MFNICFGCSKEPSHWDGSLEYPQHMFLLRNKKNFNYTLSSRGLTHWKHLIEALPISTPTNVYMDFRLKKHNKILSMSFLPPLFKNESGINDCSRETWVLAWCTSSFLSSMSIVLAKAFVSANFVLKSNISICGDSAFWSDSASLLLKSLIVSCKEVPSVILS